MIKQESCSNLCRLCLKSSDVLDEIFDSSEDNSLVMRIMASVSLEIHRSDNLPKKVCQACHYQLEKTYVFRNRCRVNESRLKRHVKLLAAGKNSSVLDELEDDDDDYEASLSYIRKIDAIEQKRNQEPWEQKIVTLKDEMRNLEASVRNEIYRKRNLRNVATNTHDIDDFNEQHSAAGSKSLISVEFISEPPNHLSSQSSTSFTIEATEGSEYPDYDEEMLEVDEDEENKYNTSQPDHSNQYIISEVSDPDAYGMDEELDLEEQHLYGQSDDSDDVLEAVTNAVKAELAEQPGFDIDDKCVMKVEKDRDRTKVEVQGMDGSIICMEFNTESTNKRRESMAALKADGTFRCRHCEQVFETIEQLKTHASTHPVSGHICNICGKWCPTKSSIDRHYRIHTGEKPFLCGECGRGFIQKEVLKRHMMIHTGYKPFPCEHCNRRFGQKNALKLHIEKEHNPNTTLVPFKCNLCDKSFKYSSGLSRHMAAGHFGRTFTCHCGRVFQDQSSLRRHEKDVCSRKNSG
ncbi:zinc finger protein 37-like [Uranotaenia lowii]|uniref:zinc finger protein 37-like n=1 Tax=Uranotaenia lowii TaxID=190385 RepID=UPI002479E3EC|nr:zinc finger protein 37-like [Uranotaenia lowii]